MTPMTSYQALITRFPLRPIRDETTLAMATAMVDELSARADLSPEETDYLEVLADQIERFEDEHHAIPDASPADVLQYLMDARGINGTALAAETGLPKSLISEVLNGTRGLSKVRISTLSDYFGVPADSFL
jgi:HTH-type transcriptional regulator/antitoxin HigA